MSQLDLFVEPKIFPSIVDRPPIIEIPGFLSEPEADALFAFCKQLAWQQNQFKIYGREIAIPRREYLEGVPDACYSYAGGVKLMGAEWSPRLRGIRDLISEITAFTFDIVIGNWYANGDQHIGWHADNDKSLGSNPAIASLSLGVERKFQIRQKGTKTQIHSYQLAHGSLLVMLPGMQERWLHRLPQVKGLERDRINLTFRPYKF